MFNHFLKIDIDRSRTFGLDILRAGAIFFVVAGHGSEFFADNLLIQKIFSYIIFDGVSIFFVLSGFLIGGILIRTLLYRPVTVKEILRFWNRRWFRTLPAYYLILTIVILLSLFHQVYLLPVHVERFYFFSQNLVGFHPNFYNEAWSLSIEEWFYIILPVVLFSLSKLFGQRKQIILASAIIIIALVTLLRMYRFAIYPGSPSAQWDTIFRKTVYLRLDSLMYGVLGAYLYIFCKQTLVACKVSLFIIGICLLFADKALLMIMNHPLDTMYACVFSFSVNSMGALLMLPLLSQIKTGKGFVYKVISYVALISYSMYLINYSIVLKFIIPLLGVTGFYGFIVFIALTSIISIIMFKYFERPITSLRAKSEHLPAVGVITNG